MQFHTHFAWLKNLKQCMDSNLLCAFEVRKTRIIWGAALLTDNVNYKPAKTINPNLQVGIRISTRMNDSMFSAWGAVPNQFYANT